MLWLPMQGDHNDKDAIEDRGGWVAASFGPIRALQGKLSYMWQHYRYGLTFER